MLTVNPQHPDTDLSRISPLYHGQPPHHPALGEPLSQKELIAQSWQRCYGAGLSPDDTPCLDYISNHEFKEERERLGLIRRIACTELDLLYGQIAGSQFAVALANENGLIMDARADNDFKRIARERNIRLGSLWQESLQGTNALGTCALVHHPVLVHGGEHFLDRYNTLTCAAAPIFDPDGNIIAILDASSDSCPRPPHTLALVNFSAKTIEMGFFRKQFQQHLILSFHSRREYRYTVSTGLIALSPEGQIVAANRQAHFFLQGLQINADSHFNDLFNTPFSQLIRMIQTDGEAAVADHVGSHYFVTIENQKLIPKIITASSECSETPSTDAGDAINKKGARKHFIANDPDIIRRLDYLTNAVKRCVPILITGDTGTGKEVFAKYIHKTSNREGDFVPVNCGAIPENLVESELFGYVDGAFTDSRKGGSDGLFHQADGGTIFLDELGELPLPTQVKLLRVLDNRRYRPVGGNSDIPVNIQVVAATNTKLFDAVQSGQFRSDLFYRLSTISIQLPNIKGRTDFNDLARHILHKIDPNVQLTNCGIQRLRQHDWPGNIRELRNFLTRLVVLNDGKDVTRKEVESTFEMEDSLGLASTTETVQTLSPASRERDIDHPSPTSRDLCDTRKNRQRLLADQIQQSCERNLYNVSRVAREMGISRSTVYKYLKQ